MCNSGVYEYWRKPPKGEIEFGYGCLHYARLSELECLKNDGTPKKWIKFQELRYNFGRKIKF